MTNNDSTKPTPPSLYEWAGGMEAFQRLTSIFYAKVKEDELLSEVFRHMSPDHPEHVAFFVAEVFGGPKRYSELAGNSAHAEMVSHHISRRLTQTQRQRWIALLLESADEINLPDDPEFRSAFVAYLEWGTRLAVLNSQSDINPITTEPMPKWGWGEVGGPYQAPSE
ncbi:globin [Rhodocytophaga rosea]|uniref:Globin n=1 Tax=Rhodocytophaga rosea TaxID=2704465 RepID=A0A6C0GPK3_9BACT|nr:group II truncated hemoglobin [Rhodocytophaga rosea]QHT69979.1 globin [Rhodocytophaga rosea]